MRWIWVMLIMVSPAVAQVKTSQFAARDSLMITPDDDPRAQAVLDGLAWAPAEFQVRAEALRHGDRDAVVSFPSPRPQDNRTQNRVPMEWYAARDDEGQVIEAPALLVVHSLHPRMPFATTIARELSRRGVHAFVLHLPGYGLRDIGEMPSGVTALIHLTQTVADVRRGRDAIAALPNVQPDRIGIAGISLGGFAAATAASLDAAFDPVMLLVSGADGYGVLQHGLHDAATVRRTMADHGYEGERLKQLLDRGDPQYVVHRLNPQRTWLFSARDDGVIPRASTRALLDRLPLDEDHHVWVAGNHYTAVLALPAIINHMERVVKGQEAKAPGGRQE